MKHFRWTKFLAFMACLIPAALLAYNAYHDQLGVNPIETVTRTTGGWTLTFLLLTLGITPLRRILRLNSLIQYRRMVGLFAFFYAFLHFTTYIALDQFFDFAEITKDVLKRPFITVGFSSFVLLIPLAATSTKGMIRRLGKRWQQLHRLVYLIAIGGVIHFLWLVKADIARPTRYGIVLALLLAYRVYEKLRRDRKAPLRDSKALLDDKPLGSRSMSYE